VAAVLNFEGYPCLGGKMVEPARQRMSQEEFLRWILTQEIRHELVDGEPVMMAGANRRHDRIASRTQRSLGNQLDGHKCQPFTSDTAIRIPAGNIRYPDLGVDCGPFDDHSMAASEPTLVVEILSSNTRAFDRTDKIEEYKTVESLDYILLVDPDFPQVRLYWRDDDRAWQTRRITGIEAVVALPRIGITLSLGDMYDGLEFRPRPMRVELDGPASRFSI
jgi:Uma2 family endonuclease